jgi:chromosome segregation ATPase
LSDSPELLKPIARVTEVADSELQIELGNLKAENENLRQEFAESRGTIESLKQELAENTRYYTARLNEAGATIGTFKDKLEAVQAKKQRLQNDLGNSQAQIAELRSQLETERASREEIETELSKLKQNSTPIAQKQLAEREQNCSENGNSERTERIHQLQAQGWGKAKIILEIWGVTKGGSPKYKAAEAEYKRLIQEEGGG